MSVIVRSGVLGGSSLSRAIQNGSIGGNWYAPRPASAAEWRKHAQILRSEFEGSNWFSTLAPAFACDGAARERLERAAEHGIVVTTGQQPGLFGGPIYTWSKAMSAVALADALQAELEIPVAPVFWAATDDTDWLEASSTWFATAGGLECAALTGPASEGVAMRDIPLGDLADAVERLKRACGSSAHASILETAIDCYSADATIGGAFVLLMRALLEPHGMAVLDAAHPTFRNAADGFLRSALRKSLAIDRALESRSLEIRSAGYSAQVETVSGLSLVFKTERDGTRKRVQIGDSAEVAVSAASGTLGANVLLRPVLERSLMPTACYLAGPGELAYFAQVAPVATAMDAAVPVVAPRWAAELVEQSVVDRMERLGIAEEDLKDRHAAEGVIAAGTLDESIADSLERLRVMLETQLAVLGRAVADAPSELRAGSVRFDSATAEQSERRSLLPPSVIEGLDRDMFHKLQRFERRALAAVKRRETSLMLEIASLRASLWPDGSPAERKLNIIPLLVKYGPDVLVQMRDAAGEHARSMIHASGNDLSENAADE